MQKSWNRKNRVPCRRFALMAVFAGVLLTAGCGAKQESGLTVEEVKAAVFEHAGILGEQAGFVQIQLDTNDGAARYEVEFTYDGAEYDYTVDAKTGEILSMNCESGIYETASVPEALPPSDAGRPVSDDDGTESESGTSGGPQPGSQFRAEDSSQTGPGAAEQDGQPYIGVDAAKQAALEHAGLQEDEVRFKHARLESDDGYWIYEVEFYNGSTEYDYDIDAQTGRILSYEHESAHGVQGDSAASAGDMITAEQAEQTALAYAGVDGADAQHLKTKFDYDDGRAEYEVEWYVGQTEYSCEVDAFTGEVLSFEKELN